MNYTITIISAAEKQIKKLQKSDLPKIKELIDNLKKEPFLNGSKK